VSNFAQFEIGPPWQHQYMSVTPNESMVQFPSRRAIGRNKRGLKKYDELTAELQASLAREKVLLSDQHEQSKRQLMLSQEFEHRLVNGL
jgi:hypothetical protein